MKKAVVWQVGANGPERLAASDVALERVLEDWIEKDITIAVDDVLVIDRQTMTDWSTRLDLLGMDAEGNLVILELKRKQTLRDTVAQAIEYAAWASRLSYDRIVEMLVTRFGSMEAFETKFQEKFGSEPPDQFNGSQRIVVVAPEIDAITSTVVQYLAATYLMPINVAYFDVFTGQAGEPLLVRLAAVEEEQARQRPPGDKRPPRKTLEEIREVAVRSGCGSAFDELLGLNDVLPRTTCYAAQVNLRARALDGKLVSGVIITPERNGYPNAIDVAISIENLSRLFGRMDEEISGFVHRLKGVLLPHRNNWQGWERFGVATVVEAQALVKEYREIARISEADPAQFD